MMGNEGFWFTRDFGSSEPKARLEPVQETPTRKTRPLVLVVDDEKLIADTVAEILMKNDFRALAVYDGKRALDVAKRLHPDYLLADVLMPSMNGVELAVAMREASKTTRIFLFSGQYATSGILEKAAEEGHHFELIPKPIHPEKLVQALKARR